MEAAQLDAAVRDVLNADAPRRLAVLKPSAGRDRKTGRKTRSTGWMFRTIRLIRTAACVGYLSAVSCGSSATISWKTLQGNSSVWARGREVRLRYAYLVSVSEIVKDDAGKVVELRCKVDLDSRGGRASDGRKVKGTIHWVSAAHAVDAEVRLYDPLFTEEVPGRDGRDVLDDINPGSLAVIAGAKLEASLADADVGETVQFERHGYFVADRDGAPDRPVYNRTVGLRDSWAKIAKA